MRSPMLLDMLQRQADGTMAALMECPHCNTYGWQQQARPDDSEHFECAHCFANFTYRP